jgi:hypothetical protein
VQPAKPFTTQQHSRNVVIGCVFVLLVVFGFSAKSILVKLADGVSPQLDAISRRWAKIANFAP